MRRARYSRFARSPRSAAKNSVLFHCDAAQAFGKVPIDVNADGIDLMSVSAHKLYGPKGVGALYVRRRKVQLASQMDGGGHEGGRRSGTLNVPAIVGFGEACALCSAEMPEESARLAALRDRLWKQLRNGLEAVSVNGSLAHRLSGKSQCELRGSECRNAAHESARGGSVYRVSLLIGGGGAQPCTARPGTRRGSGAIVGAFRVGSRQYSRRNRLRSRQGHRVGDTPPGLHSGALETHLTPDIRATGRGRSENGKIGRFD